MLCNIFDKVKSMKRDLSKKKDFGLSDQRIMVISTHGRDENLIKTLKNIENAPRILILDM